MASPQVMSIVRELSMTGSHSLLCWAVLLALVIPGSFSDAASNEPGLHEGKGDQAAAHVKGARQRAASRADAARASSSSLYPWPAGPLDPAAMKASGRPAVVFLHAPWCQWCRVLEHEVLGDPAVDAAIEEHYNAFQVNTDRAPLWMDLPDVPGLPCFVFFDAQGRHVLSRAGYRPVDELVDLLNVVREKIERGELTPYDVHPSRKPLASSPLSPKEARDTLKRLEREVFFRINSNDGGFGTPSRLPYPNMLLALQAWTLLGAPERVDRWIARTVASALRGASPRLEGHPLPDMDFDAGELKKLSEQGADAGPRWREGIDRLPDADPYRGLQDPIDHGVFRYAAGPGWYHPHFERGAFENMAWILLLRARGENERADAIAAFVRRTFLKEGLFASKQRSDPFYYRLRADERRGVEPPPVDPLFRVEVQAMAARVWPERCAQLLRLPPNSWPAALWTPSGFEADSPPATPDAFGEVLIALAACRGQPYRELGRALSRVALARWREGLMFNARLNRLAAGLCAMESEICPRALATIRELPIDLAFPPPFAALARHASRR